MATMQEVIKAGKAYIRSERTSIGTIWKFGEALESYALTNGMITKAIWAELEENINCPSGTMMNIRSKVKGLKKHGITYNLAITYSSWTSLVSEIHPSDSPNSNWIYVRIQRKYHKALKADGYNPGDIIDSWLADEYPNI